ncbi:hypothetical protein R0L47_09990 [Pectobacterium polonicum]
MAKPDMESIKRDYCAGELSIQNGCRQARNSEVHVNRHGEKI